MKCFCNKCMKQTDENKLHTYKLYSVITHVGATMSVGHYIAYTCSLDIYNEYLHCGGKRKLSAQFAGNGTTTNNSSTSTHSGGSVGEKTSSKLKKLMFKNKASSSGDMSKSLKQPINGLSKMMINGMEKLSFNSGSGSSSNLSHPVVTGNHTTVCQGLNCCGIYVKDMFNLIENYNNSQLHSAPPLLKNGESNMDYDGQTAASSNHIESDSSKHSGNGHRLPSQQTWYKCDDHKIDLMTQREFEELLSPNQKVMVTPYLLFYARYDNKTDEPDQ